MSGRSRSGGSSSGGTASGNMANAQSQVGQATQKGTNDWLSNLMGNQSSMIGQVLGPLIQGGQEMMASNPRHEELHGRHGTEGSGVGSG